MKIRILFILSAIFISSAFAQQWKVLSTPDFKKALTDIYMVSDKEGWTVGNGGIIYHTTDGFKTVELQNSNVIKNLAKVYFSDASTGWIATTAGTVLKTNDGGKTWTEVSFASLVKNITFAKCGGLYFVDSSTGFIVAGKTKAYYMFKTVDGGQNWALKDSLVDAKTSKAWTDIRFFDKLNGVIVGDIKGTQKYTEDGGESWKDGDSVVYSTGNSSVRYLDSKTLITVGEGNAYSMVALPVFKSTDGGKTWVNKTETSTVFERIQNVYFKDAMNGIAVGHNGFDEFFTYSTKDGGETWGDLDYLIYDMPPGTGDIQLTLVQTIPLSGAVIVTTPQEVSLIDARKGLKMFSRLNVPLLGVVENMSCFIAPDTGVNYDIFGNGGGKKLSEENDVPFLGGIPIDPRIRIGGDNGQPIVDAFPESEHAKIIMDIASRLASQVSISSENNWKVEIIK